MEEPLDRKLSNRIIEVFDEFEDDSADLGWQKLREKYPVKSLRPIAWLWVGSAAALLLVFFSVWIFIIKEQKPKQQIAQHTETIKNKNAVTIPPIAKQTPVYKNEEKTVKNTVAAKRISENKPAFADQYPPAQKQNMAAIAPIALEKNMARALPSENQLGEANKPILVLDSNKAIAQAAKSPSLVEKELPGENLIHSFLDDDKNPAKTPSDKKINFGVFAGTYMSYAKGSDNQFNVGAGISSDFKLSKNLKISTGVAILQNTFNYERNISPVAFNAPAKMQMLSSPTRTAVQTKGYRANLVGLDIPVNLKYEFNQTKNSFFIAAGLSSGTFINESYTYQYGGSQVTGFANTKEEEKTPNKHFDNFNFVKTLNISFGSGHRLGKHNKLFIEPFIKYPLEGIGAENLRFGSGGINLRLNFQPSN